MFVSTGRIRSTLPSSLVLRRLVEAFPGDVDGDSCTEDFAITQGRQIPIHVRAVVSRTVPPRVEYRIEAGNGTLGLMLLLLVCVPALVAGLFAVLGGPLPAPAAPGWIVLAVLVLSLVYAGAVALAVAVRVQLARRRLLAAVGVR